jgi:pimeloyl-ACP methyl ester carboxylesterase
MPKTAEDRFITVNDLRLHYRQWGRAGQRSVILLHACGCHAHWWDGIGPTLAAEYRVIAPDLRGHGDSERPEPPDYRFEAYMSDLAGLVKALGLRDFVLVGHSMGGAVGLLYASTQPVGLVAAVGADMMCEISGEVLDRLHQAGRRPQPIFPTREDAESRFRFEPPETSALPEVLQNLAREAICRMDEGNWTFKFDRRALKQSSFRVWDLLPDIKSPVLIVHGELSTIMPAANAERVAEGLLCGEWATIPGAYHNLMLDNPTGFIQVIQEFFAKVLAPKR